MQKETNKNNLWYNDDCVKVISTALRRRKYVIQSLANLIEIYIFQIQQIEKHEKKVSSYTKLD